MDFILSSQIAKRCPNGMWKDPENGKCISQAEWKRKYRKNAPTEDEEEKEKKKCPKGYWKDRRTGECIKITEWKDRPKARGGNKDKKPKKEEAPPEDTYEPPIKVSSQVLKCVRENRANRQKHNKEIDDVLKSVTNKDVLKMLGEPASFGDIQERADKTIKAIDEAIDNGTYDVEAIMSIMGGRYKDRTDGKSKEWTIPQKAGFLLAVKNALSICPDFANYFGGPENPENPKKNWYAYARSLGGHVAWCKASGSNIASSYKRDVSKSTYTNPLGEKDQISFHFDAGTEDIDGYLAGSAIMTHEFGHVVSYAVGHVLELRPKFYIDVANSVMTPAERDKVGTIENPCISSTLAYLKKVYDTVSERPESSERNNALRTIEFQMSAISNPGTTYAKDYCKDAVKECEEVYCKLYGIKRKDLNPFDMYSGYGYYADTFRRKVHWSEPSAKNNTSTSHFERIAEAFSDVCIRGEKCNSMSSLLVAHMVYSYNKAMYGDDRTFEEYIMKDMSKEDIEEARKNRIIKFIPYSMLTNI